MVNKVLIPYFIETFVVQVKKNVVRLSSEVPRYFRTQDKDDQLSLLETDTSQIFPKVNHKKTPVDPAAPPPPPPVVTPNFGSKPL